MDVYLVVSHLKSWNLNLEFTCGMELRKTVLNVQRSWHEWFVSILSECNTRWNWILEWVGATGYPVLSKLKCTSAVRNSYLTSLWNNGIDKLRPANRRIMKRRGRLQKDLSFGTPRILVSLPRRLAGRPSIPIVTLHFHTNCDYALWPSLSKVFWLAPSSPSPFFLFLCLHFFQSPTATHSETLIPPISASNYPRNPIPQCFSSSINMKPAEWAKPGQKVWLVLVSPFYRS